MKRLAIGLGPASTIGERASGAPSTVYAWPAAAASASQAELDGIHTSGSLAAVAIAAGSCAVTTTGPQRPPDGLSVRAAAAITGAISGAAATCTCASGQAGADTPALAEAVGASGEFFFCSSAAPIPAAPSTITTITAASAHRQN